MEQGFLAAMKARRSYYKLKKNAPVSGARIRGLVEDAVKYTPSAFHMQSARACLLLGENHDRFWSIVYDTLKKMVPEKGWAPTEEKILSLKAGFGTVLFFIEDSVVEQFAEKFSTYRENFPVWAQQENGMLQFALWNLLEQEGMGASLHHYNPLIDEGVKKEWSIPDSWRMIAQMAFGLPLEEPEPKSFVDVKERVLIFD